MNRLPDSGSDLRCGASLPKGKRLCDTCRTQNRQQTKRHCMRTCMRQRRSGVIGSHPGAPFPAQSTHVARGSGEDRPLTGHPQGSAVLSRLLY
jgi:hypothetical protein